MASRSLTFNRSLEADKSAAHFRLKASMSASMTRRRRSSLVSGPVSLSTRFSAFVSGGPGRLRLNVFKDRRKLIWEIPEGNPRGVVRHRAVGRRRVWVRARIAVGFKPEQRLFPRQLNEPPHVIGRGVAERHAGEP